MYRLAKLFTALLLITIPNLSKAQDTTVHSALHQYQHRQMVAPALCIATGTAATYVPQMKQWSISLRDAVMADHHAKATFDDYMQYLPAASVYGLKLCGLESRHSYRGITNLMAGSYLLTAAVTLSAKQLCGIERPDGSNHHSFPSGHTATAFTGAEILRREYGEEYPLVGIAGYTVAAGVGLMRVYNNRHWASDVVAGAGVGILCASLSYWLAPYLRF